MVLLEIGGDFGLDLNLFPGCLLSAPHGIWSACMGIMKEAISLGIDLKDPDIELAAQYRSLQEFEPSAA
jgi:hypothetical protein